ncbi:hypothetical protein CF327_g7678, partial [Tilletia walkeri]
MPSIGTLHGSSYQSKTVRILALANYVGAELEYKEISIPKGDTKTPEYLAKFPWGKLPAFEGSDGFCVTESCAITRYIAATAPNHKDQLLGSDPKTAAKIDLWSNWGDAEIFDNGALVHRMYWGGLPYSKPLEQFGLDNLNRALAYLDKTLATTTFLVGHRITVADISVASNIRILYTTMFGPEIRSKYPNVLRYLNTVVHQPGFGDAFSKDFKLATATLKYTPPQKEEKPKAAAAPAAPAAKKEKKPKAV